MSETLGSDQSTVSANDLSFVSVIVSVDMVKHKHSTTGDLVDWCDLPVDWCDLLIDWCDLVDWYDLPVDWCDLLLDWCEELALWKQG